MNQAAPETIRTECHSIPSTFAYVFEVRAGLNSDALTERAEGERIGRQIRQSLHGLPTGQILVVDFSAVRVTSYFALQEALAVLYPAALTPTGEEKYLILYADEENTDLFDAVNLIARGRRCVIPTLSTAGKWRIAGKLTQSERITLAFLTEAGTLTTVQLQAHFELLPSAASNRLRKLHQMRVIRREEQSRAAHGGREYLYMPLAAPHRKT